MAGHFDQYGNYVDFENDYKVNLMPPFPGLAGPIGGGGMPLPPPMVDPMSMGPGQGIPDEIPSNPHYGPVSPMRGPPPSGPQGPAMAAGSTGNPYSPPEPPSAPLPPTTQGDAYQPMPQEQQTGLEKFMDSPGLAMLNQGITNADLAHRRLPTPVSALQAYQQQVGQQTQDRMQEQVMRQRDEALKRSDPFYEFTQGKLRGIIPEDMPWEKYVMMKTLGRNQGPTSNMRDFAQIMYLKRPQQPGESAEDYKARTDSAQLMTNLAINPITYQMGGGGVGVTSGGVPGSSNTTLVSPQTATTNEGNLSGTKEDATKWAGLNADWEKEYGSRYPEGKNTLHQIDNLINFIDANKDNINSGFVQGRITTYKDPIMAYLNAQSNLLTIPSLKEAKLNPVTEHEFATVKEQFVDALRDPLANRAALVASYNDLRNALARMKPMQDYYREHKTLKGYGANVGSEDELPPLRQIPGATTPPTADPNTGKITIDLGGQP